MNFLKKIHFPSIVFTFLICFSSAESFAQDTPEPEAQKQQERKRGNREEMMAAYNVMLDSLGLTEQQRDDVDFINTKYRAQMQQIRQSNEGDFEAMRPKMKELRDKQNAELKEVFTDEQFSEYQQWQKENRSRRRGGGQPQKN
jgi:Spy/CpxP family protein refolding chaperone